MKEWKDFCTGSVKEPRRPQGHSVGHKAHIRETAARSEEPGLGGAGRTTGPREDVTGAIRRPDPQGVSGRRGRGLTHGGRPAGPAGQPAVGVGVRGPQPAQTPRRGVQVAQKSSLSAGGRGRRRRRRRRCVGRAMRAGGGRPAVRGWSSAARRGPSLQPEGRTAAPGAGHRPGRRQRAGRRRCPEPGPEAAAPAWSAIPGTKASTTRAGGGEGTPRRLGEQGGGGTRARARRGPPAATLAAAAGGQPTLPRAAGPGPEAPAA